MDTPEEDRLLTGLELALLEVIRKRHPPGMPKDLYYTYVERVLRGLWKDYDFFSEGANSRTS